MLAIFGEIAWCNQTYYQSLTHLIVKGYRKESKVYRKQFCCGHWSRERCIFNAAYRKCDLETYEKIREDAGSLIETNRYASAINCDEYEHNAPVCGGSYPRAFAMISLSILSSLIWTISILIIEPFRLLN
ncbi:hypothetical protein NH340_JMT00142 [Sarcoptes scabiei]|nr:hypothetical protein NH340_JMT00142 [Sarcoptes scabiei]